MKQLLVNSILLQLTYNDFKSRVMTPKDIPAIDAEYRNVKKIHRQASRLKPHRINVDWLKRMDEILEFYAWVSMTLSHYNRHNNSAGHLDAA